MTLDVGGEDSEPLKIMGNLRNIGQHAEVTMSVHIGKRSIFLIFPVLLALAGSA